MKTLFFILIALFSNFTIFAQQHKPKNNNISLYEGFYDTHNDKKKVTLQIDSEGTTQIHFASLDNKGFEWYDTKLSKDSSVLTCERGVQVGIMKPYPYEGNDYKEHHLLRRGYFCVSFDSLAYEYMKNKTLQVTSRFGSVRENIYIHTLPDFDFKNEELPKYYKRIRTNPKIINQLKDEIKVVFQIPNDKTKPSKEVIIKKWGNFDADIQFGFIEKPFEIKIKFIKNGVDILYKDKHILLKQVL